MSDDVIANMHGRVEQCRRLAKWAPDDRTFEALNQMADEIEADMRRLEAERSKD